MRIVPRKDFDLYWPDYDREPQRSYDYMIKHQKDMDYAISRCEYRRGVIQAGGHVGIYPRRLAKIFETVHTFEPDDDCFECLVENVSHVNSYNVALGDANKSTYLELGRLSGWSKIHPVGRQPVQMVTLDSMKFLHCDFLMLDLEGYELQALRGARKLIEEHSPVIQLEVHEQNESNYIDYMKAICYKEVHRVSKDIVFVREDR